MLSLAEFVKDLMPEQEEAAAKVLEEYELERLSNSLSLSADGVAVELTTPLLGL